MGDPEIVVIGGSAGSLAPLKSILLALPEGLPIAVFVVVHCWPASPAMLAPLLDRAGASLKVKHARDGDKVIAGTVLVAPPDRHLIIKSGFVRVVRSPRENQWRPAIDILFRSAAVAYGARVVGVILSGALDDGTAGARAIQRCGGTTIVQAPTDAQFPDMPYLAARHTVVDHVLPHDQIAGAIQRAVAQTPNKLSLVPEDLAAEVQFAEPGWLMATAAERCALAPGVAPAESVGSCPSARTDHVFIGSESLRASLWAAIRQFEQRANLCRALASNQDARGYGQAAAVYRDRAQESQRHACELRQHLGQTLRSGTGRDGEVALPLCGCSPNLCPLQRRRESLQE